MRRFIDGTRLLVAAFVLFMVASCVTMPPDGGLPRTLHLINFITANSDEVYNGEPLPTIVRHTELTYLYGRRNALGTYWGPNNTVFLVEDADSGVELHELVHYLQTLSGEYVEGVTCPGLVEPAAYRIEDKWNAIHNPDVPPADPMRLLQMVSACRMNDVHGNNGH